MSDPDEEREPDSNEPEPDPELESELESAESDPDSEDSDSDSEDSDSEEPEDAELESAESELGSPPGGLIGFLKRGLGALALIGFLWILVMLMMASKARKELGQGLTVMSRDIVQQYEMMAEKEDARDGPRVLVLNGQRMSVDTGYRDSDVSGLMESMSGDCERLDEGDESYQTCVAEGGMAERLQRLATGDYDVSGFHYRYAVSKDDGAFFVDLKPESDFSVEALFPSEGDVEGPEHADIPRPPNARRLISAYEEGKPYLATFFVNTSTLPDLQSFYRQNMDPGIWVETELSDTPEDFMVFRRRGAPDRFVALTFKPRTRGDGTVTVITEAQ